MQRVKLKKSVRLKIWREFNFSCCVGSVLLFLFAGPAAADDQDGSGFEVPERRLVYTTDSLLIRGRAELEYKYGRLDKVARGLPYDNTHAAGRRQYRDNSEQEVLRVSGSIEMRLMPHYYMEAYLKPGNWRTFRAVRWKSGFPDVLLDFLEGGELLISQAKPVSGGILSGIGNLLRSSDDDDQPEFEMRGPYNEVRTGGGLGDLMTVLFDLEREFTARPGPPEDVFFISAMRKDTSNIYIGRFEPKEELTIPVEVNGEELERTAVRCEVTLKYGHPVDLKPGFTLASLAARYMPGQPRGEAVEMLQSIINAESLSDYAEDSLVLPVSMSVYNDIHDSDKDFSGPFGLSDSVTMWVDEELGIPLRAECRLYGIRGAVVLSQADEQYLQRLKE